MIAPPEAADLDFSNWQFTAPVSPKLHWNLRREMALRGFKWDAQIGDVCTLAPFALILPRSVWENLSHITAKLTEEFFGFENALMQRPDLWRMLGLPKRLLSTLDADAPWTPGAARVMRFDFHPTRGGWKISEVNSDVPGGFTEASRFTQRMAELIGDGVVPSGDPTASLTEALCRFVKTYGRVALVAAPGYIEDQQVVANIADALRQRGVESMIASPEDLEWREGIAHLCNGEGMRPVDLVYRFYQGEWMTRLCGRGWASFFRGGLTPVCNPAAAILSESKRLPLLWDRLGVSCSTWREILPVTKTAMVAITQPAKAWVIKGAYSNTGDAVFARSWKGSAYATALAKAVIHPCSWLAQEQFEPIYLATPVGPAHICIGVYVIESQVCGIYARLTSKELIDYRALDTAVLIKNRI